MTETAPFAMCANARGGEVRPHRPARAGHGTQARADRRQDRGALPRPERHAGLLARAGADRRVLRRRRLLLQRRRGQADRPGAARTAASLFDGRIAEDFKLSTGTFVSVGPLRARVIAAGDPCVQDVVVAGINRDEIGLLIFPRLDACRALRRPAGERADARGAGRRRRCSEFFQTLVDGLWAARHRQRHPRGARRWCWPTPPSIDRGEVTDKGSINQRAVLHAPRRAGRAPVRRRRRPC